MIGWIQLSRSAVASAEQALKQGIGSSDVAAAVSLNPYQSMLELWMVKTGRDCNMPRQESDDEPMRVQ